MRKLDKKSKEQILAIHYYKWQKELEEKGETHPKYSSSSHKFYLDIVMNLFYIQKGLCAYTEQELCEEKFWKKENWQEGIFQIESPEKNGQLEHFDESLKYKEKQKTEKKDWLWDNFFMIESDTNRRKGAKPVEKDENYILKPDEADYDEFELLEYDTEINYFVANRNLSKEKAEKVDYMIRILGLNYGLLHKYRSERIEKIIDDIDLKKKYTWETIPFGKFPTAVEMYKRQEIDKENSAENEFSNYLNKIKN